VDHVPATGTEAEVDRGGVDHHLVAHGHRPRCLGDGVGALAVVEADAADARPFAEDHSEAMSFSTRSSWALNGSLQSTVRWAWSLSFRCTQSTV
jgi:hypothetical protein